MLKLVQVAEYHPFRPMTTVYHLFECGAKNPNPYRARVEAEAGYDTSRFEWADGTQTYRPSAKIETILAHACNHLRITDPTCTVPSQQIDPESFNAILQVRIR